MTDNFPQTPGSGRNVATDQVTYSGDTADVQLNRMVHVSGSEGSKTVDTITDANGSFVHSKTAHDDADAGNPIKIGARAIAHGSNPTAVAAADRTDLYANRHGIPFVIGGHMNAKSNTARRADADGGVTDGAIGPGTVNTGTKVVVTRLTVTCSNANTVNVACKIGFGATSIPADATTGADGVLVDHEGIPPGGGFTIGDGSGIVGVGADGEELRWTVDDPVGGHITCSVTYYTIES